MPMAARDDDEYHEPFQIPYAAVVAHFGDASLMPFSR